MPTGNGPKIGELQRAQLLSTHGPGAVVDYLAAGNAPVSGVTLSIDTWNLSECHRVIEPVLAQLLGVSALYAPPVTLKKTKDQERLPALEATRFPTWQECPKCNGLRHQSQWKADIGSAGLSCYSCSAKSGDKVFVVPARLMIICEHGHLDDFPWLEWIADTHKENCSRRGRLKIVSRGAGLRNLWINCAECGGGNSLRDAFTKAQKLYDGCRGKRPWLPGSADEVCNTSAKQVVTALRGSSNLYFPHIATVLTVPPWSDDFRRLLEEQDLWGQIQDAHDEFLEDGDAEALESELRKVARRLSKKTEIVAEEAYDRLKAMLALLDRLPTKGTPGADIVLRREEWRQFRSASAQPSETFEVRDEIVPENLRKWVSSIVRVPRLREVRALRGFTRRYPPDGTEAQEVASLSVNKNLRWRPAIANSGEGIFLALNETEVAKWEANQAIKARAKSLQDEWVAAWRERFDRPDETPPQAVSARSLLVHSLSHALMLELSITSGYSSASLLERLYADEEDEPMAGLLIYTATSDNEGTLGGLEREGLPNRLAVTILRALGRLEWCSSDPLCMSGVSTASDPLNGAACHSCLFVPETACEAFNRSLDRAMLIGGAGVTGYFEGIQRSPADFMP